MLNIGILTVNSPCMRGMHESKENKEHASSGKEVGCYFRHTCFSV